MKEKLIQAYNEFMKVSVNGLSIEPMYSGLTILAQIINSLPEEGSNDDE